MAGLLEVLHADLTAESNALVSVLEPLSEQGWTTPTACAPWSIKDQVVHLAWNDDATVRALMDPDRFRASKPATMDAIQQMVDQVIIDHHDRSGADLLAWFTKARHTLLDAVRGCDPKMRMPWYGPDMSVASKLTARFMETWAHAHDITEALGIRHVPTDRVRHVVFLGLQALPNTFATHGRPVPSTGVRLEVTSPGGALWHMGSPDAHDVVRGGAFELALVVTQRMHVDDSGLQTDGPLAAEWLSIAQAFAGPPGTGRSAASTTVNPVVSTLCSDVRETT